MEKETYYSGPFFKKNLILNIKKPTDKTNKSKEAEHFARGNGFQKLQF